jgi:hypothetical protein
MGLESRGGRHYYYRKERHGGRVRSVYVGSGEMARYYAVLELGARVEKIALREALDAERQTHLDVDNVIAQNAEIAKAVAESILLLSGYHLHSRTWRKKRNATKAEN